MPLRRWHGQLGQEPHPILHRHFLAQTVSLFEQALGRHGRLLRRVPDCRGCLVCAGLEGKSGANNRQSNFARDHGRPPGGNHRDFTPWATRKTETLQASLCCSLRPFSAIFAVKRFYRPVSSRLGRPRPKGVLVLTSASPPPTPPPQSARGPGE